MSRRILCKFFMHGACFKGEHCEFSHDWNDPENNVCTFYQKGNCSYGSRCRYEHVRLSRPQTYEVPSSASFHQPLLSEPGSVADPSQFTNNEATVSVPAWSQVPAQISLYDNEDFVDSRILDPADRAICSFAAAGSCPRGDNCPHIHGDLCPTCGKHCLHPFRLEEREEHMKNCEKKQKHLQALTKSQDIECSVCLDRVLLKPTPAERKFGLLSECDHPFCISCIRNWRSNSPSSGMDVNSALRACPICRKLSYFVIPSVIWYSSKEEKQEIVDNYKAKLKSIDCRHFDFGNGSCPFGTSCFYKHAYRDGSLEEVALRHLGAEDGITVIAKNIRLSDFLANLNMR
uniref:RING-type E3 ubiquitin transferase n=1 Tax=Kalanchoe fedtschenkoi TaxID=63787 RepID=A0A7N0R9I7_KALFE